MLNGSFLLFAPNGRVHGLVPTVRVRSEDSESDITSQSFQKIHYMHTIQLLTIWPKNQPPTGQVNGNDSSRVMISYDWA